jgi:ABC-type transporter Mla subunit MlaD
MDRKISTSDVLKRTARELDSLSAATRELEQTVTDLVQAETTKATMVSLQSIDLLAQTLSALTEFIDDVSDQIGTSHQTDIAQATHNLKLGDLRARLLNSDQASNGYSGPEVF